MLVLDRPVDGVEERARVGIDGRVPEADARGIVDRDLPCEPEAVRSRLPAQLGRNGCVGDAAAGDESLRGSGSPADDVQPGRVGEIQPCGCGLDRVDGAEVGRVGRSAEAHGSSRGEDEVTVGVDADGDVPAEDLEPPEPLVEVEVRDAVVLACDPAHDEGVGEVGACDTEVGRAVVEVAERGRQRVVVGGGSRAGRHRARNNRERSRRYEDA